MPAPLAAGQSVWWIPPAEAGDNPDVPEWLLAYAAGCPVVTAPASARSAHDRFIWVVVDQALESDWVLNGLADLAEPLEDEGWLWIRLFPVAAHERAGKPRWQWLVDLACRQGYEYAGQQPIHSLGDYLVFKKSASLIHRWRLRCPTRQDEAGCHALFLRAFNHPISPALWRWKYGSGRGRATMAMRGEQVIAHYGCVTRRIWLRGREIRALQICDVMVDPSERAIMTRTGAFFQVAKAAQEAFIGFGADHELGYGFPNQRHMQLAEKMGLYDEVERLVELEWPTAVHQRHTWTTTAQLGAGQVDKRSLARVWERMRRRMKDHILVARDPDYWQYRYAEHPEQDYAMLSVSQRLTGRLMGVAVLRREAEECKLLDVLAEPGHMGLLVSHARRQAAKWGLPVLKAWVTDHCAQWLAGPDAIRRPTDIVIPLNIHAPLHRPEEVRDRWFLMMGDTDFL